MKPSVLITGASSGIGAATARRLGEVGYEVFGTSRRPEAQPSLPTVRWIAMDVRDEASVATAVEEVLAEAKRLDALVCNAGVGLFGSVEEVPLERAKEQFETNFFGTLRLLRAVLPHMRAGRHGRIVVVGSLAGRSPIPFSAHYSASKAAVDALVLALRSELDGHGVHVSLVEPGDINTPFNDRMQWMDSSASPYGERIRRVDEQQK